MRKNMPDSEDYTAKQAEFSKFITVFGKKPVLDALRNDKIQFHHIHIDEDYLRPDRNNEVQLQQILDLIQKRSIKLIPASRFRIGIISKNGKQDGGIVADIIPPIGRKYSYVTGFIDSKIHDSGYRVLALDRVTNPNNLGLLIRSVVAAGTFDAILLGPGDAHEMHPLVIKASSGTSLLAVQLKMDHPLSYIHINEELPDAFQIFKKDGAEIIVLTPQKSGHISTSLWEYEIPSKVVFVVGGESEGHDPAVIEISDKKIHIPMNNDIESLNCAMAATLVAFSPAMLQHKKL